MAPEVRRLHERLVRYAEETLALGQRLGLVRAGDVRVMAACLIGSVKEVVSQSLEGMRTRAELEGFATELLRTMLVGIGAPSGISSGF